MQTKLSHQEITSTNSRQLFTLERKIHQGEFTIESVGDYLPGNIMVVNLNNVTTEYMNRCGCNILMHSVEELAVLGPEYFQKFFIPEETEVIVARYMDMHQKQDPSSIYNFAHRVKPLPDRFYKWYFASAKLLFTPGQPIADKIMVIVNEVNSAGHIAKKINIMLEENDWMKKNFTKFCRLTHREKEIISLLVSGKSSPEISDIFSISHLTVKTHRRNIFEKLEIKTFAGLYKFSITFGLMA